MYETLSSLHNSDLIETYWDVKDLIREYQGILTAI